MPKLNFGCGSIQPHGWVNIDKSNEFRVGKTTRLYGNEYFDIIVAHAVIQQVEWHQMVDVLRELRRVLKPDGILRISLPDIEQAFDAFKNRNIDWFPNGEDNLNDRFSAWLTWYSTSKTLLTPLALHHKLEEAGFRHIDFIKFGESDHSKESPELDTRKGEFFFMEAMKGGDK